MIDLEPLIRDAHALAPLPASATRLLSIVGRDDWELEEVVGVVSLDPALTGRLLRVANSALLGAAQKISTVADAVMRVGGGVVAQIATAAAVHDTIDAPLHAYGVREGELWRHSVAAALGVDCLRGKAKRRIPPEAFTAALLHDIGKLVLGRRLLPEEARGMALATGQGHQHLFAAENELFGVNHAELGGLIAQHWGLPESLRLAITHHHAPDDVELDSARVTAYAVHLADALAKEIGAGHGAAPASIEELAPSWEVLGLCEERWKAACESASERLDAALAAYG